MKPVTQDKFGKPNGNCFTACIASLLERELDDLRDFAEVYRDGCVAADEGTRPWGETWDRLNGMLVIRYDMVMLMMPPEFRPVGAYYVACGEGPRGLPHSVVYHRGELAHDPHPSRKGLTGEIEQVILLVGGTFA